MADSPENAFLRLIATLISQLPITPSQTLPETVLLQLQMIFGSMLMSALQLIDRLEVVRVLLPAGRYIWQVTSSTGTPYTIYITLPDVPRSLPPSETLSLISITHQPDTGGGPDQSNTKDPEEAAKKEREDLQAAHQKEQDTYTGKLARSLQGMYCPCTGFAYNTLSSPRNHFCKHLLAVVLAHQMGRAVMTSVNLHGTITLLGLDKPKHQATMEEDKRPKAEQAV